MSASILKAMRVLVTGAHGCIGAWVVKSLRSKQIETLRLDLEEDPARLVAILEHEERNEDENR